MLRICMNWRKMTLVYTVEDKTTRLTLPIDNNLTIIPHSVTT